MKNSALLVFGIIVFMASCKSSSKLFSAGHAPEALYLAEVPMEDYSNLQIIPVVINGKSYRFLFDTGAPMVISEELQAELNCKVLVQRNITDSQGASQKQDYVKLSSITIGGKHFEDLTAVVIDLRLSDVIACLNLDGIVGANLMRHAIWKLDYKNQMMYFTNDSSKIKASDAAIVMPFRTKASYTPVVDVAVDSIKIKSVTFDTGSGSGLSVPTSRIKKDHFAGANKRESYGHHSSGIYGTSTDTSYSIKYEVSLNAKENADMIISLSTKGGKSLLGGDFFKNYDVILDWNKKAAFLESTSSPKDALSIGFSPILKNGELVVGSLMKNSLAEDLGLSFNDRILLVNQIECVDVSAEKYCEILLLFRNKEEPIRLEIENKGAFSIEWQPLF